MSIGHLGKPRAKSQEPKAKINGIELNRFHLWSKKIISILCSRTLEIRIQKSRNSFQKVEWFLVFAGRVALWKVKSAFYYVFENGNDAIKGDKKRWKMKDLKNKSKSQSMQMCFSMDFDMCMPNPFMCMPNEKKKPKTYSHIRQKHVLNQSMISIMFCSLCLLSILCFPSCTTTSCSVHIRWTCTILNLFLFFFFLAKDVSVLSSSQFLENNSFQDIQSVVRLLLPLRTYRTLAVSINFHSE